MTDYLFFLLLGAGAGAIIAALGLGLLITYQGSGVVNFALGAMATWSAYVYAELRNGVYTFPIPGLPDRYHFAGGDVGTFWAFVLSLATAIGIGLISLPVGVPAALPRPGARPGGCQYRSGHRVHGVDRATLLRQRRVARRRHPAARAGGDHVRSHRAARRAVAGADRDLDRRGDVGVFAFHPARSRNAGPLPTTKRVQCCSATRRRCSPARVSSWHR